MGLLKTKQKKHLITALPECCFWTKNGVILKDLKELKEAFRKMDDSVFAYHASGGKNDFTKWIREVLKDDELAQKIEKAKTRKNALKEVQSALKAKYLA